MLTQTRELLDEGLGHTLAAATAGQPLTKPDDHTGGAETDMFVLRLELPGRLAVLGVVRAACMAGRTTSATVDRGLGGFVAAWEEYAHWNGDAD